jgi:RimJ/RimL family protein N-acetyltransferase
MDAQTQESSHGMNGSFDVGLFRSEDAESVARLFRSVHDEDYPIKLFYDPVQLIRANQEGDYYSIVARSTRGEIVGIHNLFRSAPSRDVYEWGVGLVLKEWRSKGVSGAIERFMMDRVVPKLGMHTVFGEPVTYHLQMQKHSEQYGFVPTALEVGLMPGEAYSGEGVISSRVSTLLSFRVYRHIPQRIFVPMMYDEAIRFLYGKGITGRTFSESTASLPPDTVTDTKLDIFDFANVARIAVHEIGSDFGEHISDVESEAVRKGCIVLQLWLKLTSPCVGRAVDILQARVFFLGGVLPQWFDDDGLLMQKLLFVPDLESIQLYSDRALRIRDLVQADWQRGQA